MRDTTIRAKQRAVEPVRTGSGLLNELTLSALAIVLVSIWMLYANGGWDYYTTPLRVRGYSPAHASLRPSGPIGHAMGIVGLAMILVPVVYSIRKKWKRLARVGRMKTWLEVHIFCGIVGPVLVTFHSSFKFNGIISIAYWSMVAVMLSGFVGRYLYVRVPKSIRGQELTYGDIEARALELKEQLAGRFAGALIGEIERIEGTMAPSGNPLSPRALVWEPLKDRWKLRRLRRRLSAARLDPALVSDAVTIERERVVLLRRLAYLQKTKQLFSMWHVFHQPLVYLMLVIVVLHVALVLYLGYTFFGN